MNEVFAEKVRNLGFAHLYGIKQKEGESDEEFQLRIKSIKNKNVEMFLSGNTK